MSNESQRGPASSQARAAVENGVDVEVIVIGSGFGGAVAACRLAQAGFDVLVVERGRRYEARDFADAGDFPPLPGNSALLPDWRRWTWGDNQGLWDILDLEELVSVQAAGWGGGSLIYANVHLRPPDEVFDRGWPEIYLHGSCLQEYFDLAAYMLEVAPVNEHPAFAQRLVKTQRLAAAANALNRTFFHPPLAIRYEERSDGGGPPNTNLHGVQQGVCTQCGACCTGCPERAKNTLDFNYLALAERHGARALTQSEVFDITETEWGFQVDYLNHLTAQWETKRCRYLFLCAGSVHTTRLLARATLLDPKPSSGVGERYFPGGDALGVVYDTDEALYPERGPTITATVMDADPARGQFSMIQDGGYAAELARAVGLLRAPLWLGRNKHSSARPRPRTPSVPVAPPDPAEFVLASPLDELLDAVSNGDFSEIFSKEQRTAFSSLLEELSGPLLLPGVVERTIEGLLRRKWKHFRLTRNCNPEEVPLRWMLWFERWCVRTFLGTRDEIARTALHELVNTKALTRHEVARDLLGYRADGGERRLMLLAMGRDAARGSLRYDRAGDRLTAHLDLYQLAAGYSRSECLMTDIARQIGGELRSNPAYVFLGKPITVHNQGGCGMGPCEQSVTNPDGRVWQSERLYILDGSLLCTSVGVNPSATILAIAERNIRLFIQRNGQYPEWPRGDARPGATEYAQQLEAAGPWILARRARRWHLTPPLGNAVATRTQPVAITFKESMEGHYHPTTDLPCPGPPGDAEYRRMETRGTPRYHAAVQLDVAIQDLKVFMEDEFHEMAVAGSIDITLPGAANPARYSNLAGCLRLPIPRGERNGSRQAALGHQQAPEGSAGGSPPLRKAAPAAGTRLMTYRLAFQDEAGNHWLLQGKKRIKDDAGLDAWRDTSSLFIKLFGPMPEPPPTRGEAGGPLAGVGVIHVELNNFLRKQLPSIRVTPDDDPTRSAWAIATFASFFFGTLQRIYLPQVTQFIDALFRLEPLSPRARPERRTPPES